MASIKVADFAFPRMEAPDLDAQEEFLTHFGLTRAARTPKALYMRGHRSVSITSTSPRRPTTQVRGLRLPRRGRGRPRSAWQRRRAPRGIETLDEPGGGKRVRLHRAERLPGRGRARASRRCAPIPVDRDPMNTGAEPLRRAGTLMRLRKSPTPIKRIGHGVLGTPQGQGDRRVVPRHARLHRLRRHLCGRQGQHHRLVQPARPRRRVRGPPHAVLRA